MPPKKPPPPLPANHRNPYGLMKKDTTPGPGDYDPKYHDTRIPTTLTGRPKSNHETPGPGPNKYLLPNDPNKTGPKLHPPSNSSSSRRNSFTKNKSHPNTPKNPGVAVLHSSSLPPYSSGHLGLDDYNQNPTHANNDFIRVQQQQPETFKDPKNRSPSPPNSSSFQMTPPGATWPRPDMIVNDSSSSDHGIVTHLDTPPLSEYSNSDNDDEFKTMPDKNATTSVIDLQPPEQADPSSTPRAPINIIFLPVPPNQSPFSWMTDGKLSIFGVICAASMFIFGIIHLALWHGSGTCIVSGLWMMIWGLLILIIEGMLLPKIIIFNEMEILYPATRLVNNRPYWVKTILYAMVAIIAIAVCAKWTSGLGGGLIILLSFAYGLKQIDQNYKNRQEELDSIHRRRGSNVPVWTTMT